MSSFSTVSSLNTRDSLRDLRICFVGDSFVQGTGDPSYLGWVGRVCQNAAVPLTAYNLGIRGYTSRDIAIAWQGEVSRRLSSLVDGRVVFSFGTNDTTWEADSDPAAPQTSVPLAESIHNARHILETAHSTFPVLMISPPPIADPEQNQRTRELWGAIAPICRSLDIPSLNIFIPLLQSEPWMHEVETGDGAHPQSGGYAALADLIQKWPAWQAWLKPD